MTTETDPNDSRLRIRAMLSAQFSLLLVVCVVCALLGAGVVYGTHVDPGTETETQVVSSWSIDSEYVHSATVTEPNPVFAVGDELTDRDTYFTRVAPELDVAVETTYDAASAEDVSVDTEAVLITRDADDETVYWEREEPLVSGSAADLAADDAATVSFVLNSTAIDEEVSAIEDELGASPGGTETVVRTRIEVDGSFNGEAVTHTESFDLGIDHAGDTYSVDDPGPISESADQTETVVVERTYGPLRTVGGPLLLLVGLAGTGGLAYARREGRVGLTDAERAYLDYRDDRAEFDEWITRIRLPESVHERPEAAAESLKDLVDFAIDHDAGVIEDPSTGAYHAVSGEFVYTYVPPEVPGPSAGAADGDALGPDRNGVDGGAHSDVDVDDDAAGHVAGGDSEPAADAEPAHDGTTDGNESSRSDGPA